MRLKSALAVALALLSACGAPPAGSGVFDATPPARASAPARPDVLLATTTSTQDSGLLDVILPDFERATGYRVKSTAVGTGAALALGAKGDADVLLVHAPASELAFMGQGNGDQRLLVMHNDFLLVGPASDPAGARGRSILDALKAIAETRALFISRGDGSGTDLLEKALLKRAGVTAAAGWYVESGTGMGQSLTVASEKRAYIITDRATYLARRSSLALESIVEGGADLLNIYHVITVSAAKFPRVNRGGADAFASYLVSPRAQAIIASFGKNTFGQSLFFADAGQNEADLR
ncbi:MAG: substrate-binding domain-containing protein [Candidatus Limnocylindria bacterium]